MKFNSFQGLEQETAVTESRGVEQPTQGGQRVTPEPWQPEQHTLPVPHMSLISADQRCHHQQLCRDLRVTIGRLFEGAQSPTPASSALHLQCLPLVVLFSQPCCHQLCPHPVLRDPTHLPFLPSHTQPYDSSPQTESTLKPQMQSAKSHPNTSVPDLLPPGIAADGVCFDRCLLSRGAVVIIRLL